MKSKITTKCAAILMSALIGASSCAIPTFAATTANDDCINPSAISSIFSNNNQESGTVLIRRPEDIKPMSYDYVVDNIDKLVSGLHDKGVVMGSSGIDLTQDIKILDPRIVYVKADFSNVDLSKSGQYPAVYTVCYKPVQHDTHQLKAPSISDTVESYDGSSNYIDTDLATKLQPNEYVMVNFNTVVNVGVKSFWDAVLKNPEAYYRSQAIKSTEYIYQSNMEHYDHNVVPTISHYYNNMNGKFLTKTVAYTHPVTIGLGYYGVWCAKCGAVFTPSVWGSHMNAAISTHENTCHSNWITKSGISHTYSTGDTVSALVFSANS